jgi:hypothetical protein
VKILRRSRATRAAAGAAIAGLLGGLGVGAFAAAPAGAEFTTACSGADEAENAFEDAGLAADCLALYGIAQGKADGTFGESDALVRTQISSLLVRLLQLTGFEFGAPQALSDTDDIPNAQVRSEVELLVGSEIIAGFPDGSFGGSQPLTVAQFATLLLRVAQLFDPSIPIDTTDTANNVATALWLGLMNDDASSQGGTTYDTTPSATAVRGLVADSLAELLNDLVEAGEIENLSPDQQDSNATIDVDPTTAATVVDDGLTGPEADADTSDTRTYTASGLTDGSDYRVTLVDCRNVVEDESGRFSFQEDGTSGLLDPGDAGFAFISSVNGDATNSQNTTSVGSIAPEGGSITVIVDAEGFGCLRPVFFADGGADTNLEIADNGEPSEDFGVGGAFNSLPPEAPAGDLNVSILAAFDDQDMVVVRSNGNSDEFTVSYDSGDEFFTVGANPACGALPINEALCDASDITEFEALASAGDVLTGTYDPAGDSTLVLDDQNREGPTITGQSQRTTTSITLTLTGVDPNATQVQIYLDEGDLTGEFDQATVAETVTADANVNTPGFQVVVDGLTPATAYTAFATQTVDGEESAEGNAFPFTTAIDQGRPTITAVDVRHDSATFTLTVAPNVQSVRIYLASGSLVADFAAATPEAPVNADEDPNRAGFQVTVDGLTPDTAYSAFATQTVGGEESQPSSRSAFTTTLAPVVVALTSVAPNDPANEGIGTSNAIIATFASAVDCGTTPDLELSTGSGDPITATACAEEAGPNAVRFTLSQPINDAVVNVQYTAVIGTGSVVDANDAPVTETQGTFDY